MSPSACESKPRRLSNPRELQCRSKGSRSKVRRNPPLRAQRFLPHSSPGCRRDDTPGELHGGHRPWDAASETGRMHDIRIRVAGLPPRASCVTLGPEQTLLNLSCGASPSRFLASLRQLRTRRAPGITETAKGRVVIERHPTTSWPSEVSITLNVLLSPWSRTCPSSFCFTVDTFLFLHLFPVPKHTQDTQGGSLPHGPRPGPREESRENHPAQ